MRYARGRPPSGASATILLDSHRSEVCGRLSTIASVDRFNAASADATHLRTGSFVPTGGAVGLTDRHLLFRSTHSCTEPRCCASWRIPAWRTRFRCASLRRTSSKHCEQTGTVDPPSAGGLRILRKVELAPDEGSPPSVLGRQDRHRSCAARVAAPRESFAPQTICSSSVTVPLSDGDRCSRSCGQHVCNTGFANVCFAAYLALLRRWSQQETVHVGRVADNRTSSEARSVGPFENQLPTRADFQPTQSFADFVRDLDAHLARDRKYESCSFDRIAKLLQKSRDPSRNPVFQAMFRCSDVAPLLVQSTNWSIAETSEFERLLTPYDVTLDIDRQSDSGAVRIVFDEELFEPTRMQSFGDHFLRLLGVVADTPEMLLDCVPILDGDEMNRQLEVLESHAGTRIGTNRTRPLSIGRATEPTRAGSLLRQHDTELPRPRSANQRDGRGVAWA